MAFLVWEAAKKMSKRPSEIWNMPLEDRKFIFQGIRYDAEVAAGTYSKGSGGQIAQAMKERG